MLSDLRNFIKLILSELLDFIKTYYVGIFLGLIVLSVIILTYTGQIVEEVLYSIILLLSMYVMILPIFIYKYTNAMYEKAILILMFIGSIPMMGFAIDNLSKLYPGK